MPAADEIRREAQNCRCARLSSVSCSPTCRRYAYMSAQQVLSLACLCTFQTCEPEEIFHSCHPSPAQVIQFTPTRSRPNFETMSASLKDRLSTNSSPPTSSFLGSNAAGSRNSKNRYRCGFELPLSLLVLFVYSSWGTTHSSLGPGAKYLVMGGLVSAT